LKCGYLVGLSKGDLVQANVSQGVGLYVVLKQLKGLRVRLKTMDTCPEASGEQSVLAYVRPYIDKDHTGLNKLLN
jgi:hypothetical protein